MVHSSSLVRISIRASFMDQLLQNKQENLLIEGDYIMHFQSRALLREEQEGWIPGEQA